MPQEFKRMPAIEKLIADVDQKDIRVRVLGTVIDRQDNTLVLDDGTGKIVATFDDPVDVKERKLVRIIGRVMPVDGGLELRGEIVQNMEGLDIDVFKKLSSINKGIDTYVK